MARVAPNPVPCSLYDKRSRPEPCNPPASPQPSPMAATAALPDPACAEPIIEGQTRALAEYVKIGQALNDAKNACKRGHWLPFLHQVQMPERTAQRMMKAATIADENPAALTSSPTVHHLLAPPEDAKAPPEPEHPRSTNTHEADPEGQIRHGVGFAGPGRDLPPLRSAGRLARTDPRVAPGQQPGHEADAPPPPVRFFHPPAGRTGAASSGPQGRPGPLSKIRTGAARISALIRPPPLPPRVVIEGRAP